MQIIVWFIVAFIYSSICSFFDRREVHKIKYAILCTVGTFLGVVLAYRLGIPYLGFDFVTFSLTFYSTVAFLLIARVIENIIFSTLKHQEKPIIDANIKPME